MAKPKQPKTPKAKPAKDSEGQRKLKDAARGAAVRHAVNQAIR